MALSEQSRHQLYAYFSATELGEEATSEMLSYFPARDVEEPVTKAVLREELALVRMELHNEIADLREGLRSEFRAELRTEIGAVRTEMGVLGTELRTEIGRVDAKVDKLQSDVRQILYWLISTQAAILAVVVALVVGLH